MSNTDPVMNHPRSTSWPAGYSVNPRVQPPQSELIEAFRKIPVTIVGDCMGRITGARGLNLYHGSLSLKLCGPAITVKVRPGDNLMIHKAMTMAKEGDVIVVDGGGDLTQAVIGGLMRTTALAQKLGGFVIDGAIRDLEEWAQGEVPIFARGNSFRGPSKDGPGEVNVPIACSGLVVNPGDLILGDADGVIAIPPEKLSELYPAVLKHIAKEDSIRKKNMSGVIDTERFDNFLRQKGCPV